MIPKISIRPKILFGLCVLFLSLSAFTVLIKAQSETDISPELEKKLKESQKEQEKACKEQKPSVKRTYTFRDTTKQHPFDSAGKPILPDGLRATYGPPPKYSWLRKVIPFWSAPVDKYGLSLHNFKESTGREVPVNESKSSKKFRLQLEENIADDAKNKSSLPKFDWRDPEHGSKFSPVEFQGWYCKSCWAFSTVEAMEISRQLVTIRMKVGGSESVPTFAQNNVRQMAICLTEKDKKDPSNSCEFNWHGEAFSFMVDEGIPLDGTSDYSLFTIGLNWTCDAKSYVKALTWDYVSAVPHEVASTGEIKRALVTYGPIVTTISFDNCLNLYGGGVFNEEQNFDVSDDGKKSLKSGSHILLIVGWDDTKQAWLVRNSYGEEWGENGYGWIKYGSNNIGQFSAWILADPNEKLIHKEPSDSSK